MYKRQYYDRLATGQALNQLQAAQAALALAGIRAGGSAALEGWLAAQGPRLARVMATLDEICGEATLTVSRLLVAAGQLQEVAGAASGGALSAIGGSAHPNKVLEISS